MKRLLIMLTLVALSHCLSWGQLKCPAPSSYKVDEECLQRVTAAFLHTHIVDDYIFDDDVRERHLILTFVSKDVLTIKNVDRTDRGNDFVDYYKYKQKGFSKIIVGRLISSTRGKNKQNKKKYIHPFSSNEPVMSVYSLFPIIENTEIRLSATLDKAQILDFSFCIFYP